MRTKPSLIFLMGPTASGKTKLALEIVEHLPCEIVSVDSAMVYRGLDIGTAKPDKTILANIPHHLINIQDPSFPYSAGQFRNDALTAIESIVARNKIPLLVGGTMLYFRVLQQGLAPLPCADQCFRETLLRTAEKESKCFLHSKLSSVDSDAAKRIHPNDVKRLLRALEVYHLTGVPLSVWQRTHTHSFSRYHVQAIALLPYDRMLLHKKIELRFHQMIEQGFINEVRELYARSDLSLALPSMQSVGYRELWRYVAGDETLENCVNKAIASTRQLAKRQITWLRSWPNLQIIDAENPLNNNAILKLIA